MRGDAGGETKTPRWEPRLSSIAVLRGRSQPFPLATSSPGTDPGLRPSFGVKITPAMAGAPFAFGACLGEYFSPRTRFQLGGSGPAEGTFAAGPELCLSPRPPLFPQIQQPRNGAIASSFSPRFALTNTRQTIFPSESFFSRRDGAGRVKIPGTNCSRGSKTHRNTLPNPLQPRAVSEAPRATARLPQGKAGKGLRGAREAEAPSPGREAAASSLTPLRRRGWGPRVPDCCARF